jgi:hypothetical protein
VGTGSIVAGVFLGAVSALAISKGRDGIDTPDPKARSQAAELAASGVLGGIVALGYVIGGLALSASSPDPGPLKSYYRETYVDPR